MAVVLSLSSMSASIQLLFLFSSAALETYLGFLESSDSTTEKVT